jgi:HSP20 family molecular chaperone IbpA
MSTSNGALARRLDAQPLDPIDLFDEFFDRAIFGRSRPDKVARSYSPTIREGTEDGKYFLEMSLPGVDPDTVEVKIEGRGVVIKTPNQSFYHSIGQRLDVEGAEATFKWGVLRLTIPTREAKEFLVPIIKTE